MGSSLRELVRRRPLALLLLLCALAWLPGFFTIPALDRDESRFAQATKQMLETGDFVDINLGAGPRYEKPVGIYWMQAASTAALGGGARDKIWTYRVPSFLGALGAVAATFFLADAIAGTEAGFVAGLILGFSLLLTSEAHIAKTDAMLLAATTAVQCVLLKTYLAARGAPTGALSATEPSVALALFGWAALAIGILIKGPVILLIAAGTIIALVLWDRDWRWLKGLRPLYGVSLALLIALPWLVAIGIATHGLFFEKSLGGDFAMKLVGDQEAHGAPPGYYTLLAHVSFWPGSLLLLPGLVVGFKRRKEPAVRFLIAWAGIVWLMFELAPTKLPHYVLPAYPALAILSAMWAAETRAPSKSERVAQGISLILFLTVGLAFAAFLAWAPQRFGMGSPWWLFAVAAMGGLMVLSVIPPLWRGEKAHALGHALLAGTIIYAGAGFAAAPRVSDLWLSTRMADAVARHAKTDDPPVVTAGYAEPSILFLLGTGTRLDDGQSAGRQSGEAGGLALVEENEKGVFLSAAGALGASPEMLEEIDGLNYSRGRSLKMTLYRVVPKPK
jgi:4-amino-4-deoxy-L-arabinose transferase-like glycosyltransferase